MTDPVTRAKAAISRVLYSAVYRQSPSNFVQLFTEEVSQEIEQAVLVERKRCAEIARGYNPYTIIDTLEKQRLMIECIVYGIEEGEDCDENPR